MWNRTREVYEASFGAMTEEFEGGADETDIAARYGVSGPTISRWLTKAGYKHRGRGRYPIAMKERAAELHSRGWSMDAISNLLRVDRDFVDEWVSAAPKPEKNPRKKPAKQKISERAQELIDNPPWERHKRGRLWTDDQKKNVLDLPQSDIVYLVGCGPSLEINGHWLRHVNNGVIIALNDAVNWVLNADYFLCMDHAFKNTLGNPKTTAILAPTVRNELARLPWKDVCWMRSSAVGTEPFNTIHQNHPNLWLFDEGLNCTFTAYQLIAQIFQPKCLVLVGCDCGFSQDRERMGKPLVWNDKDNMLVIPDAFNRPVLSNGLYSRVVAFTLAVLAWYTKHNCQVVIANAGGALPLQIAVESTQAVAEFRPLEQVVQAAHV